MLISIKFNILITQTAETKNRNVNNNFPRPKKLLLFATPSSLLRRSTFSSSRSDSRGGFSSSSGALL